MAAICGNYANLQYFLLAECVLADEVLTTTFSYTGIQLLPEHSSCQLRQHQCCHLNLNYCHFVNERAVDRIFDPSLFKVPILCEK